MALVKYVPDRKDCGEKIGRDLDLSYDPNYKTKGTKEKGLIFFGYMNSKVVAIRRIIKDLKPTDVQREIDTSLENFSDHVLSMHCNPQVGQYMFIISEAGYCSLADLYAQEEEDAIVNEIRSKLSAKEIHRQITHGLERLHANGFAHRNLKPSNVLLVEKNGNWIVKLADFRKAKNIRQDPKNSNPDVDKIWAPPEIIRDQVETVNWTWDIFSLGLLFYYISTEGQHPFGNPNERIRNMINTNHKVYTREWAPEVADSCASIIKSMLQFDPVERISLSYIQQHNYFKNSPYYELYDGTNESKPGLCVIFDNERFPTPEEMRHGTEFDRLELQKIFMKFGYDIRICLDSTAAQLVGWISQLAKMDYGNFNGVKYNSVVVCILSHGGNGVVYGTDMQPVNIDDIIAEFDGNRCASLFGKPKIFVVQACQGNKMMEPLYNGGIHAPSSSLESDTAAIGGSVKTRDRGTSSQAAITDLLSIMSTIPDHVSVRSPSSGTWFIQELSSKLKSEYLTKGGKERNLNEVFHDLVQTINQKKAFIREEEKLVPVTQTPQLRDSLTANIAFREHPGGQELEPFTNPVETMASNEKWTCLLKCTIL